MNNRYRIVITGKRPDYFIRELIKRNVNIYDLVKEKNKLEIVVDRDGIKKINSIKTSYKYKIIDRYGLIKVKYMLKKYAIFLICFGVGILINILLSRVIFDVDVIHSNSYIRELVYNDLADLGIRKFNFKVSYRKKEEIVKEILKRETNDIEWLEIEDVGTKYIIKVEQRKKNKETKVCENKNIVAKKDAMILEILADQGEVVTKKLDYVKKGDILISGVIHNKEDIVSKRCAEGKVFGEVWYQVHLEVPKRYEEVNVTGREKKQLEIEILDKRYTLFNNFKTYKREEFSIIKSNLLPFSINYTKYLETNVKTYNYSIRDINSIALDMAQNKLLNKLGEEDTIISKKVLKKEEKESKILVDVFVKVKEDITDYKDIVIEEEKNEE